jgi:hypothetical protein
VLQSELTSQAWVHEEMDDALLLAMRVPPTNLQEKGKKKGQYTFAEVGRI